MDVPLDVVRWVRAELRFERWIESLAAQADEVASPLEQGEELRRPA